MTICVLFAQLDTIDGYCKNINTSEFGGYRSMNWPTTLRDASNTYAWAGSCVGLVAVPVNRQNDSLNCSLGLSAFRRRLIAAIQRYFLLYLWDLLRADSP